MNRLVVLTIAEPLKVGKVEIPREIEPLVGDEPPIPPITPTPPGGPQGVAPAPAPAAPAGARPVIISNEPHVFVRSGKRVIIDSATLKGAIFDRQGGPIVEQVGRISIIIQNQALVNIYISDKPDRPAGTGWQITPSGYIGFDVEAGQSFYVVGAVAQPIGILQLLEV
jgi:hypothetical protein